ncbi:MAG: nitric-oxide reductase large subunit [Gammaproteobacteria bacterium]|nr:nitric-oxide reductase large subunit [Gammaproteobacteria bacterium]
MMKIKYTIWGLLIIMICSFSVLLSLGSDIYQEAPPLPQQVITTQGDVIFSYDDIDQGQQAWRSMGGHQLGSIWGHGSYVAPDWTADWIHREALAWLELASLDQFNQSFKDLTKPQQAGLEQALIGEIKPNNYQPASESIVISPRRAQAIAAVTQHYQSLFSADPATKQMRIDYAMKDNTLVSAERRENFSAFVFWTAWAAVTQRPDQDYTYTHNWPYDEQVGNDITSSLMVWSILSVCGLIFGIGALVFYHASIKAEHPPIAPTSDSLFNTEATASQKVAGLFFVTAIGLFLLQILLGAVTAHYAVEGQAFYGIEISQWIPYSLTRTWHTQLAVFWIATAWLGTGLYIAPALSGYEPKYQWQGALFLLFALVVIVLGSMAGEWFAIQQVIDLDISYWFGHQGQEYIDLGRFWQLFLMLGLVIWLVLVTRAIYPVLSKRDEQRPMVWMLYLSCIAIGGFYFAGLGMGKHTNLAIAEYWRWWVVHLWVEGFFETFAVSVTALFFVRLGLVSAKSATAAVLFSTLIFLTGGIIGTTHHLYFTGTTNSVIAWGAMFSALEVVPLAIIGFEAIETYRMRKMQPWVQKYHWAIMFFVATAFWNLIGAGVLGFLINTPIALYFIQGLNTTATHAHAAFMGVYGNLGIGLMLFCLAGITKRIGWQDRPLKWAFWSINIGLMAMLSMSLFPVGIIQFFASVEHGYWFARSSEVIQSDLVRSLVWNRTFGDIIFGIGGLLLGYFVLGLLFPRLGSKNKSKNSDTSTDGVTGLTNE